MSIESLCALRHHTTQTSPFTARVCIAVCLVAGALFLPPLLPSEAQAQGAPEASEFQKVREGFRIYAGGGVTGGFLDFRSDTAITQADLGQIPSFTLGVQNWIDENAGFDISYQGSFGGSLATPQEPLGGQELGLNAHRIEGNFLYRWFTGPRIDSMAFGLKLGFVLQNTSPSEHTPSIILSTTYSGPQIGPTARIPFTSWMGIEADAAYIFPFNVREFPDRSGSPKDPSGFQAGGALYLKIGSGLYTRLRFDLRNFQANYGKTGTRGLGNVTNGQGQDQFRTAQLLLEWIL